MLTPFKMLFLREAVTMATIFRIVCTLLPLFYRYPYRGDCPTKGATLLHSAFDVTMTQAMPTTQLQPRISAAKDVCKRARGRGALQRRGPCAQITMLIKTG